MHRREFLIRSASGLGAAWWSSKDWLAALATQTPLRKFSASPGLTSVTPLEISTAIEPLAISLSIVHL